MRGGPEGEVLSKPKSLRVVTRAEKVRGFLGRTRSVSPSARQVLKMSLMVSGTEDLTSGTDPPRNSRSLLASLAPSCAHPPVPSLVYQTNGKVRQSLEGGKS